MNGKMMGTIVGAVITLPVVLAVKLVRLIVNGGKKGVKND